MHHPKRWPVDHPLILLDVGARGGAVDLRRLAPYVEVYGVEPHPEAYAELATKRDPRPGGYASEQYFALALDEKEGMEELHLARHASYSSFLPLNRPVYDRHLRFMRRYREWRRNIESATSLQVPVTTLEQFAHDQALRRIDLLKLDTQGTELRILRGGQALLERGAVSVIRCEVSFLPFYLGQCLFSDVDHYLRQLGFEYVDCRFDDRVRYDWGAKNHERPSPVPGVYDPTRYSAGGDAVYFHDPGRLAPADRCRAALSTGLVLAGMGYFGPAYDLWTRHEALPAKQREELIRFFARRSLRAKLAAWANRWLPPALMAKWRNRSRR